MKHINQRFPNIFTHGPLVALKNNNGSSHNCSCKFKVSRW